MRIVFNTKKRHAPASAFYLNALRKLDNIRTFDWEDYSRYDIALFMTYEEDLADLKAAKERHSDLLVGLIDPRGRQTLPYMEYVDFLIIDSIEMKDFFSFLQKPMFMYHEYPEIPVVQKSPSKRGRIVLGYHGNRTHLLSMYPNITGAIDLLGEQYDMEFWAVYNIKRDGESASGLPRKVPVKHIQWHEEVYQDVLAQVDIGIAPGLVPIESLAETKRSVRSPKHLVPGEDDYLIRFKMPSNAGRLIVFGLLGLPVVSDFLPSYMQVIKDGENGLLAYSSGGWYRALEALITSADYRLELGRRLQETVVTRFGFPQQNKSFLAFCEGLLADHRPKESLPFGPDSDGMSRRLDRGGERLRYALRRFKRALFKVI
ncbi:MAG: hypothetical protein SWH78_16335 [Thermodesulfobacteriota bacterium]|nr:hypothetical protein [Thermodesulfobacteriota bacterium]